MTRWENGKRIDEPALFTSDDLDTLAFVAFDYSPEIQRKVIAIYDKIASLLPPRVTKEEAISVAVSVGKEAEG